jgi:hypothetical protein
VNAESAAAALAPTTIDAVVRAESLAASVPDKYQSASTPD